MNVKAALLDGVGCQDLVVELDADGSQLVVRCSCQVERSALAPVWWWACHELEADVRWYCMMLMEAGPVASQGCNNAGLFGDLYLCSPGSSSVDPGFGSLGLPMEGNVEVVLAKVVEFVDDSLSAGCIG